MAHQPVGTGSSITVSVGAGHARTSGVISHMSDTLRVAIVGDSEIQDHMLLFLRVNFHLLQMQLIT